VFDPISARIAEDLGFEAGMFAGSIASFTVLGAPDLVVLTLTELAEQCRRICRASDLPLLVDADHGFGNALNVMRTVEELERAGIAGLTIEDTALPAPFGQSGKSSLISMEEGIGKMRAAVAARGTSNLVVIGRTSAPSISGIDDAVARLTAYERTGVDALFIVGVRNREQLDRVTSAVGLPIILGNAPAEMNDLDYLASKGVRICLQGHQPFMAAVSAIHKCLAALRSGTPPDQIEGVSASLLRRYTRDASYAEWARDFLGTP
jgi:carboxyvinyl-carboxyphosphonate phosphorylmutase